MGVTPLSLPLPQVSGQTTKYGLRKVTCDVTRATVPLKCKLTGSRSSILETRFSILDSRKLWGSRLKSSFEMLRPFEDLLRPFENLSSRVSRLSSGKNKGLFARLTFDKSEYFSLPVDLFWFQVHMTYKFLDLFNNKIRCGAFLSLTFFSECFLDEFYKILAKKTRNYSMTLLLFQTVMQSCRFHGIECSSYQVSFPSSEVLLPFSEWILHPFKNL